MADLPANDHAFLEHKHAGYCNGTRTPLIDFLASSRSLQGRALDVGCGIGQLGAELLERGFTEVVGIEPVPHVAERARAYLSEVHTGTFQNVDRSALGTFDLIVFSDSLEHMLDPWGALVDAREMLAPGGALLLSVPNVAHWSVVWALLRRGRWDYADEGLLDRTHLRFFTPKTLAKGLGRAGFEVAARASNESTGLPKRRRWMRPLIVRFAPHLLVFQERVVAVPKGS